jgi:hypothetical protein
VLLVAPTDAEAFEVSGGVSFGGVLAGSKPHFSVTPQAGITWRTESRFLVAAHEMFSIMPATNKSGVGVYNRTSVVVGYAAESINLSAGPSLSIYFMPACNAASLCARVVGLSPGLYAQASMYFAGPLGATVSAGVDWIGGSSRVLPGGVAATIIAGPVLRWIRR